VKTRTLLLAATALAAATTARGEAAPADVTELVVTGTRAPTPIDQVGQSITVLSEEMIRSSQAIGMTELLAQTPGVTFSRNGAGGKTTSVYIRGAETGQTVILIDGVRLNDPSSTDTGASLSDVVTGEIARVEVLRGAQSTLWGSQAIGGVISSTTREPTQPVEYSAQVEGGGLKSALARAGVGGVMDKLTWRVGGGYATTDGVSAFAAGRERDGYINGAANARLTYRFSDAVSADVRAIWLRGRNEFDGFNADALNYGVNRTFLVYTGLNVALFDGRLQNRVSFQDSDLERKNYDGAAARRAQPLTFDALGISRRYEYQGDLKINDAWSAVFGVEREENFFRTASPTLTNIRAGASRARADTTGYYGQLQARVADGLTLIGGLRHEDQSTFGGHTVFSAAAAWRLNDGDTVLRASYAEGFKAPSLFNLYSDFGNVALNPESAESWDIGAEQKLFGRLTLAAVYFERDTTNLIIFVSCTAATRGNPLCAAPRTAFYDNVGKVRAKGFELGASLRLDALTVAANYTQLDAINTTPGDANRGKRLARRPEAVWNLTANYDWAFGLKTGVSVRHVGDSFNNAPNTQVLEDHTLVDVRASYPITENIEVYGRIENAFDEDYETTLGFGTTGRVAYGGVRLRF